MTFSRGWKPGKRGTEAADYHAFIKTATNMCRLMVVSIYNLTGLQEKKVIFWSRYVKLKLFCLPLFYLLSKLSSASC